MKKSHLCVFIFKLQININKYRAKDFENHLRLQIYFLMMDNTHQL